MTAVLIKAGRLFDGRAAAVHEGVFVACEGASVRAVGKQADLGDERGRFARVMDLGPEVTLLPGLINMHAHMAFSGSGSVYAEQLADSVETKIVRATQNLRAALETGVTTVRDCGTLNAIALALRQAVAEGICAGPRIVASGEGITTTGGHCWYCCIEADSEVDVRRAVRAQAKAGVDFIKLFSTGGNLTPGTNPRAAQYTEAEMCAATEEARRLGLPTVSHAHGTPGVQTSVAARVTTIEHCSFLTPEGISYDERLAAQIAELGIYVCPTISRGPAKLLDEPGCEPTPAQKASLALKAERLANHRRLAEQGVKLVAGNDAGVNHVGFADYPGDLVLMSEGCGFSPEVVLRSATSVAAQALGRDDLGIVAPEAAADLLAVRGDPLADLHALLNPVLVVAQGRTYPLA